MAYLGKCYLCEIDNVHRLPVYLGGRIRLICHKHGASTLALYDAMNEEMSRRVRIHKTKDGYSISRMYKEPYGGYKTSFSGRQHYKKWETILKEAKGFIA